MNDPENFLTRWSRRKRRAADEPVAPNEHEQDARKPSPMERAADAAPPTIKKIEPTEPVFDLSKLPSIDSITAETDIRAFLAPGVPAELRLAALRRAWVADPKVRDFVGLADYDFDFHTPGAIPGFGPLTMTDELRQEVTRIVSAWQSEPAPAKPGAETAPPHETESPAQRPAAVEEMDPQQNALAASMDEACGAGPDEPQPDQVKVIADKEISERREDAAASQQQHPQPEDLQNLARRGHGRALPK